MHKEKYTGTIRKLPLWIFWDVSRVLIHPGIILGICTDVGEKEDTEKILRRHQEMVKQDTGRIRYRENTMEYPKGPKGFFRGWLDGETRGGFLKTH